MSAWVLYVVRCADTTLYTGITTDVTRRVHEHNHTKKGARYTRSRRPVRLVHTKTYSDRSSATRAENAFKALSKPTKERAILSTK